MAKGVANKESERTIRFTKEVFGMAMILFSVLSFMCLVAGKLIYPIGEIVSGFFLGVFGYYSFVFLVLTGYVGLCLLLSKSIIKGRKAVNFLVFNVLLLSSVLLAHLLTFNSWQSNFSACVSSAYGKGSFGYGDCTVGGVFATMLNYPLLIFLNKFGASAVFVAVILLCLTYFVLSIRYGSRGVRQKSVRRERRQKPKTKRTVENVGPAETETATDNSDYAEQSSAPSVNGAASVGRQNNSGLFVYGNDSFMTKSKKDVKNQSSANYDIAFNRVRDSEELITHQPQKNYSSTYSQDLDNKLEYIKTAPKIDLNNLGNSPMGSPVSKGDDYSAFSARQSQNQSGVINKEVYVIKNDDEKTETSRLQSFDRVSEAAKGRVSEASRDFDRRFDNDKTAPTSRDSLFARYGENRLSDNSRALDEKNFSRDDRGFSRRDFSSVQTDRIVDVEENVSVSQGANVYTPPMENSEINSVATRKYEAESVYNAKNDYAEERNYDCNDYDAASFEKEARIEAPSRVKSYGEFSPRNKPAERVLGNARAENDSAFRTKEVKDNAEPADKPNPFDNMPSNFKYKFPPLNLLEDYAPDQQAMEHAHQRQVARAQKIVEILENKGIQAKVEDIVFGPSVTRFVVSIPPSVQIKTVLQTQADLKFWLEAPSDIRLLAPIPGTSKIGIEVPNDTRKIVGLKSVLSSKEYRQLKDDTLSFVLGQDIIGAPVFLDILSMPHLLVAGSTGTGKSACLNTLLISLLYRYSPDQLRLILVDPKQVEFSVYTGMPHLMFNEIIFEQSKALAMLDWANQEMARRYGVLRERNCRNIGEYNRKIDIGEKKMPFIVIIIDEFAQLIMSAGDKKNLENKVGTLAQLARAAGIHLIFSTQRPSADILDGTIKNNFTSKICFKTSNGVSSSVVLGETGAERLLGKGDVLYQTTQMPDILRAQGAYIGEKEVERVVDYIKTKNESYFNEKALELINQIQKQSASEDDDDRGYAGSGGDADPNAVDEVYLKALRQVIRTHNASKTSLQTKLSIGYPKAAKIVDWMERKNFISPAIDNKSRKINITREEYEEIFGPFEDDIDIV
ncbi:MAG: DNA translocase FtsK [Christensenellaceae bacterium]